MNNQHANASKKNEQTSLNATGWECSEQDNKPARSNLYLEAAVMTASPQQLVLMLYDGAIRFMNQAVIYINARKMGKAHESNMRAQDILWELLTTLQGETEITKNLSALYSFMIDTLIHANIKKDAEKIRDVIDLVKGQRDTWQQAMDSVREC